MRIDRRLIRLTLTLIISTWGISATWIAATPAQADSSKRSVYQISPLIDGSIIGITGLATLVPTLFGDHWIHPRCPCDPSEVNGFDRGAIGNSSAFADTTSDITAVTATVAPVVLNWLDLGASPEFLEDLTVYTQVLTVNGALVTLAKYTVQRPLPRTYAGEPDLVNEPGGYRSFYSGHTSLVFSALSATSVTLNLRYQAGIWPWLVTVGVGTSVAAERVLAGRHFPTDVMMGAVAGTVVGTAIPLLHRRMPENTQSLRLMPIPTGAILVWTRRI